MRQTPIVLLFACLMCGCNAPYNDVPDAELHRRARALPLERRYDFYLEVYAGSRPHNGIVADDIVALGDHAWTYSMDQAIAAHNSSDLHAKLLVLQAFDKSCTVAQYNALVAVAWKHRIDRNDFRYSLGASRQACGLATGKTVKEDEQQLTEACKPFGC